MPRPMPVPLSDGLVVVAKGAAAPAPEPGRRNEPVAEKRVSMTFRLTAETYEWLRRTAFEARTSQQALLDEALDRLRAERSRG
jgi:hypothetical protein